MKKYLIFLFAFTCLTIQAQDVMDHTAAAPSDQAPALMQDATVPAFRFGYLSYNTVLQSMPDYAMVQQKMSELRDQYEAEIARVEDEFNRKYEEFLDGQRDFPKTILQKRQTELQDLMTRNISFKENSKVELAKAEQEAMAPLRIRLIEALGKIARERGYAFIVDTDVKALPYINPNMGDDLNQLVQDELRR